MRHSIIVTGYNCEQYAKECIDSLVNLDYNPKKYEILVYNDASTDDTESVLEPYLDSHNVYVWNAPVNKGALYGRYHLARLAQGSIVSFVGLDDKLHPQTLKVLDKYYTKGVKMTWGTWQDFKGKVYPAKQYDPEVWQNKSFRRAGWRATALNTFKRSLLLQVPIDVLQHEGEFYKNCTDLAYSFPCLEMINEENTRVVKEPVYIYRHKYGNSSNRKHDKTKIRELLKNVRKCN